MTNPRKQLLLVDDDPDLLRLLKLRLASAGFIVEAVGSGQEALSRLAVSRPHAVVTDLRMDDIDGMALFNMLREQYPTLPVIMMTAHGTIEDAVEATRQGVFGFIPKPIDHKSLIEKVNEAVRFNGDTETGEDAEPWRQIIITKSPLLEEVMSQAARVAQGKANIFLSGQSGTGKELLARAIHTMSPRKDGPFVAVNCSAIPESLFEAELFGYRKGAFTGAVRDHDGLFRAAQDGTLFLDEIGDMPRPFQAKLLRAVQEMCVRPIGATQDETVDLRLICATHVDMEQALRDGNFREDLYYRLSVVTLSLPTLSERPEDISVLAMHFLRELAESYGVDVRGFSPEAMEFLIAFHWPGNIRQLRNVVEQCLALSTTSLIPLSLVQKALREAPASFLPLQEAKEQFERTYLARLLQSTNGNVSQAAKLAKRNRTEFYRLLSRYGMNPALFKSLS
jgi:two-component system, NtrC family, response regulator GlrR